MDAFSWFAVCVIVILVVFLVVFTASLMVERKNDHTGARVYELRIGETGNVSIREKKNFHSR